MKLTKAQQAIIIGTVLGDGFLQKTGKHNARICLEHSQLQQEYLGWKAEKLGKLFQGKASYLERVHPVTRKTYRYVRAQSNASPLLGKIRSLFYQGNQKIIPVELRKLITPLALAVWYMDDGYYYRRDRCAYLYLGRVNLIEAERVRDTLKSQFELETKVLDKKNKGFAIYFSPFSAERLKSLIGGFVLESLKYKLPS